MTWDRKTRLLEEREQLVDQWSNQKENRAKLLMRIIEIEERIEEIDKGARR